MLNYGIKNASFPWNDSATRSGLIEGPFHRNCQGARA